MADTSTTSTVQSSFFWNGDKSYGQEELDAVFYSTLRSGVNIYDDGTMGGEVTVTGSDQVTVAPFIAHVDGAWYYNQNNKALTVDTSYAYARVVVTADFTAKETRLELIYGSSLPGLNRNHFYKYQISLAYLVINSSGITVHDERTNTSVCGGLRTRGVSEFDQYFKQVKSSYNSWFAQAQGDTSNGVHIYYSESTPTDTVVGALWLEPTDLTGDSIVIHRYDGSDWHALSPQTTSDAVTIDDPYRRMTDTRTLQNFMPGSILGVYNGNAFTLSAGGHNYFPFSNARAIDGFTMDAGYAYYEESSGLIKTRKAGIYRVDASLHIRNIRGTQTVHVGLRNHNQTNVAENYARSDGGICTASFSGLVRLHDNDSCGIYVYCSNGGQSYQVWDGGSAPSQFTMTPVKLIDE